MWWSPLANYIFANVDIPKEESLDWYSNRGQFVSEKTALKIAEVLEGLIADGSALDHQKAIEVELPPLCSVCKGENLPQTPEDYADGVCAACSGTGRMYWYPPKYFSVENLKKFYQFCRESEGFKIFQDPHRARK